jgi:rubrerythrin
MSNTFSACEVIELSIQIEKNGREFYSELALRTDNAKAIAMFEYLAAQEEKHIDTFKEMFADACDYNPAGAYPEEYFAYMSSLSSSYVFTQKDKGKAVAAGVKDYNEGVDLGISFEKESILFYAAMKEVVPEKDRDKVDAIIREEKKHLRQLCEFKGGDNDEKRESV